MRGVAPNEKEGSGAAGRAGGSRIVSEAARFGSDVQRQAESGKASANNITRPHPPASPMGGGVAAAS